MIRFLVADKSGMLVGELQPEVNKIVWRINDIGQAQFRLARTDPKATEAMLRFGNRVLIEFDNGLPAWTGVIDTPREWDGSAILCNAYSAEYLLGFHQTGRTALYTDMGVGRIYQDLIEMANAFSDTGITIGNIWLGGPTHTIEHHYKNILAIIREQLCGSLSDYDYDVTGGIVSGRLVFQANLYERKGADKQQVVLVDGVNAGLARFAEQGAIINHWQLSGGGTGWGDTDRIYAEAQDGASIGLYGLRQGQAIYNDITYQGSLQSQADTLLAASKDTHAIFDITASDLNPGKFSAYGVGDVIRVQLPDFGFSGYDNLVRIDAREYDPAADTCRLAVREA